MNLTDGVDIFVGVIVDIKDPLLANRVKVRIFGLHDANETLLSNDNLPWALVLMPNTGASMTGIGSGPHGLKNGSTVVVKFLDGIDQQVPLVVGTIMGFQDTLSGYPAAFRDSENKYPLNDRLKEPDTNRLSRNQNIDKTIVPNKKRSTGVSAGSSTWDQPTDPYNAKYPNNQVIETPSGHIIELDDTEGAERIHIRHKSGSYTEFHPNGDIVQYNVGSGYETTDGSQNILIKGACNITVDGDANTTIKGNSTVKVDGNSDVTISGTANVNYNGNMTHKVSGNYTIEAGGICAIKGQLITIN